MKKKQIIGLGTLLLVCLLGLFSTSYANITESELKNYAIYLGVNKGGKTEQYMIDWLETATWTNFYNPISNYIDNDNYDIVLYSQGTEIYFYYRPSNTTSNLYISSVSNYSVRLPNFNGRRVNTISTSANNSDSYNSQYVNNLKANSFYTDLPIYSSDSYSSITFASGTCYPSSDIFDGPFEDALPFTFIPKPSEETADVYYFEDVPLYNASGEDLYLGQLFEPVGTNIVYWTKDNYYYRYGDWNIRQLPVDSIYLEYFTTDNDVAVYDVYLQSKYIYENTIYSSVWADGSTEPYALAYTNFYIKNNNTIVTNGVVDVSGTFSGDYKEQYDNEIDNIQDIENIKEGVSDIILDSSEVDNILSGFTTSGEIASAFGYHNFSEDSDFDFYVPHLFITKVIEEIVDELLREGDRYIDISFHGETPTRIYARFFRTPEDNALIIFVRWCLIFGSIYCFYSYIVHISEELSTLNIRDAVENTDTDRYIYRM